MAEILKGKPVADAMDIETQKLVNEAAKKGQKSKLAILRVGERSDDLAYERGAVKRCEKLGIEVEKVLLPADCSQADLMAAVKKLNKDESVHGVLMFRPLPSQLDEKEACESLLPAKDVDGITPGSMSYIYSGNGSGFAPCTAEAVIHMLRHYGASLGGSRVTVVGRSLVIGKPVSMLLMKENATVTVCHSRTADMPSVTRGADIVVAALGKAEFLGSEYFSEGQTVIDVGINYSQAKEKLVGDVDFDKVSEIVAAISPVPAGVGSVTTAVLARHVAEAAVRKTKK